MKMNKHFVTYFSLIRVTIFFKCFNNSLSLFVRNNYHILVTNIYPLRVLVVEVEIFGSLTKVFKKIKLTSTRVSL
jgi:hypothetical protein